MTSVDLLASEESLGYKAVLLNLESIITALKVNKSARNALIWKCQAKEWFDCVEDPSPEELMKVVLNRIKQDGTQYVVFMKMLGSITGLDVVKDRISNTRYQLIHKQGGTQSTKSNLRGQRKPRSSPHQRASFTGGEPPEKFALRHNVRVDIISAISRDLGGFKEGFVQEGFITSTAAGGIMGIMGVPNNDKASQLFQSLEGQLNSSRDPQNIFECFVGMLVADKANEELAIRIMENYVEKVPQYMYNGKFRHLLMEASEDGTTENEDLEAQSLTSSQPVPVQTETPPGNTIRRRHLEPTDVKSPASSSAPVQRVTTIPDRVQKCPNRTCGMITGAVGLTIVLVMGLFLLLTSYTNETPLYPYTTNQSQAPSSGMYSSSTISDQVSVTASPNRVWMDETPNFALLQLIKYTDDRGQQKSYRFIQEIQNNCKKLGAHLGIDKATIYSLDKRSDSSEEFCENVLSTWIERGETNGRKVTWGRLLEALKDAQLGGAPYTNLKEALTLYYKRQVV